MNASEVVLVRVVSPDVIFQVILSGKCLLAVEADKLFATGMNQLMTDEFVLGGES